MAEKGSRLQVQHFDSFNVINAEVGEKIRVTYRHEVTGRLIALTLTCCKLDGRVSWAVIDAMSDWIARPAGCVCWIDTAPVDLSEPTFRRGQLVWYGPNVSFRRIGSIVLDEYHPTSIAQL